MPRCLQDVRHAFRGLRRKRFVSGLAILAFTLGIGITVAALAVVVVLLTLPTRQAPRSPGATPGASVTGESPR